MLEPWNYFFGWLSTYSNCLVLFWRKIGKTSQIQCTLKTQLYQCLIGWTLAFYDFDVLCCGIYITYMLSLIFISGKSVIGGRKALENRRFIKHLTSRQYSSGFQDDLNKAWNKIMTGNKLMADKSKEKRKVIKKQTKATKTSMTENILLTKVRFLQQMVQEWGKWWKLEPC